jgi:hypothetical protein
MSRWILWLYLTSLAVGVADAVPPIEAFGTLPELDAVALSESGRLLAWGESAKGQHVVVVLDLEAGTSKARFGIDSATKLRDIRFATDATLLITVSVTHTLHGNRRYTYEWFRTLAADLGTGRTQHMTNDRLIRWRALLAAPCPSARHRHDEFVDLGADHVVSRAIGHQGRARPRTPCSWSAPPRGTAAPAHGHRSPPSMDAEGRPMVQ